MEKNIIKRILHIDGMTCTGCETRIENSLKKLEGIEGVKAIFNSANVYITYNLNYIKLKRIIEAIEKNDYRVLNNPLHNSSVDSVNREGFRKWEYSREEYWTAAWCRNNYFCFIYNN